MTRFPRILLLNPWITDFAAYDLWSKPLGLLMLGALLRQGGCSVDFLDCLDRHDSDTNRRTSEVLPPTFMRYGTGKYPKMPIERPAVLGSIPRRYYRYGIHPDSLREKIERLPRPDMVWVTCAMTYWYPGAREAIRVVREMLPRAEVWLGGVYAQLCPQHAREHSGADRVVTCGFNQLPDRLGFALENRSSWAGLESAPSPALDLVASLSSAPLLTSLGCPLGCPYCASPKLQPVRQTKPPAQSFDEIRRLYHLRGVRDFAFTDDALLADAQDNLVPLLEAVCRSGMKLRFHTPNAVHIRLLAPRLCRLMVQSGFTTIRLGLETTRADRQRALGGKTDWESFLAAVHNLTEAGFPRKRIGAYLLCGLPDQSPAEVAESVRAVSRAGVQPHLSEYSPIPGTRTFEAIPDQLRGLLEAEPLLHNNSVLACRQSGFDYSDLVALKNMTRLERRARPVV